MKNFYLNLIYEERKNPHYYGYQLGDTTLLYSRGQGLAYSKGFTIIKDCTRYGKYAKQRINKENAYRFIKKCRKEFFDNYYKSRF